MVVSKYSAQNGAPHHLHFRLPTPTSFPSLTVQQCLYTKSALRPSVCLVDFPMATYIPAPFPSPSLHVYCEAGGLGSTMNSLCSTPAALGKLFKFPWRQSPQQHLPLKVHPNMKNNHWSTWIQNSYITDFPIQGVILEKKTPRSALSHTIISC